MRERDRERGPGKQIDSKNIITYTLTFPTSLSHTFTLSLCPVLTLVGDRSLALKICIDQFWLVVG